MPQSLAKILLHTVFSTKDREPLLSDKSSRELAHRYLGGILNKLGCQPVIVGGTDDHVHLLFALGRTATVADVVKELKRSSSKRLKQERPDLSDFQWQAGYGVFSVGFSQLGKVRTYIANQEAHHRKLSFQDELLALLDRYHVDYDKRFLWE